MDEHSTRDDAAPAIRARILERLMVDRTSGELGDLAHYQRLFPDHGVIVEQEFARITEGTEAVAGAAPTFGLGAGTQLGRHTLGEELGRGGQGRVFRAYDGQLKREVALKVIPTRFDLSPEARRRFELEAELASRLDDPGICTVYDMGESEGLSWIAMQLVPGEPLSSRISSARQSGMTVVSGTFMDLEEPEHVDSVKEGQPQDSSSKPSTRSDVVVVVELLESAARALHVAHEAGLIHRDIKPGNIMVTPDGRPVILDFGLARDEESGATLTLSGDLLGTPAYMSPEQLTAARIGPDRRSDVWSLGVTLYECLALERPFQSETREGLYQAILGKDPQSLVRRNPNVPRDLAVIVEKSLEKDRDRRYATALELAEDLRRFRCYEPILARPVGMFTKSLRWTQRNRVVAAACFIVVITLSATLAVTLRSLDRTTRALAVADDERAAKEAALKAEQRQVQVSEARRLMMVAREQSKTDSSLGLRLAVEAAELLPGLETNTAMMEILERHRVLAEGAGRGAPPKLRPGSDQLLVLSGGLASLLDARTGREVGRFDHAGAVADASAAEESIRAFSFRNDGEELALVSRTAITIWHVDSREMRHKLEGIDRRGDDERLQLEFADDDSKSPVVFSFYRLGTVDFEQQLIVDGLWPRARWLSVSALPEDRIASVGLDPDEEGIVIAVGNPGQGSRSWRLRIRREALPATSRSGKWLATLDGSLNVEVRRVEAPKKVVVSLKHPALRPGGTSVPRVWAIFLDDDHLATMLRGRFRVWSVPQGELKHEWSLSRNITGYQFQGDDLLLLDDAGTLTRTDPYTGATREITGVRIERPLLDAGHELMLTVEPVSGRWPEWTYNWRVLDTDDRSAFPPLDTIPRPASRGFSWTGSYFEPGSENRYWNSVDQRWQSTLAYPRTQEPVFSPDGRFFVGRNPMRPEERVFRADDGKMIDGSPRLAVKGGFRFSNDGRHMLGLPADQNRFVVWATDDWRIVWRESDDAGRKLLRLPCLSGDGSTVAVVREETTTESGRSLTRARSIRVWRVDSSEMVLERAVEARVSALALDDEGTRLAYCDTSGVSVVTVAGGDSLLTIREPVNVVCLEFHPGRPLMLALRAASGSSDAGLQVLELPSGNMTHELALPTVQRNVLASTEGGKAARPMATFDRQGENVLFSAAGQPDGRFYSGRFPLDLVSYCIQKAGRRLSTEECQRFFVIDRVPSEDGD